MRNSSFSILTAFFIGLVMYMSDEISEKKKQKLNKIYEKYKVQDNLIIGRVARKTLRFIEKNTENFPNQYKVLKDKIIVSCYNILEWIYRANVFQNINDKKEIVVQIQILNFYLEEALKKDLLTKKKFFSYGKHLTELDLMIRSWISNEKGK